VTPEHLDVEDLMRLADILGVGPLVDVGALDGAAARSRSRIWGLDSYSTLELRAAALMHSICRTPALEAENEKLAVAAGVMFLRINGSKLAPSQDEAVDLARGMADGRIDVPQAAEVLTN
jgi:death-on-curing protein